jgi:hypothetical protein
MKSLIFKDADDKTPPDPKAARMRAILLALPFALLGIVALVMFLHDELIGGMPRQKAIATLSFIVTCIGFTVLILGINAKKMAIQKAGVKASMPAPEKPWLKRAEWTTGRIASGSRKSVLLLWIFVVIWCGISGMITLAMVPPELRRGNHAALIALVFPLIGIAMLFYAVNTTLAWRKFGQSIFEMAALPAGTGGTLEGQIQVRTKLRPEHGLHLRLSCLRRTTTGSGKSRHTTERILWQDEKWLRPELPQADLNATGIPVYFKLPGDLPESAIASGDGVHWRLEVAAKLRGPNFHATFTVPVFKLTEPPEISDDPTAQYQMSLDEVRQQVHSKIQVNVMAEGKEFIFPAARNPSVAAAVTVMWLVFTSVVAVLLWYRNQLPMVLPVVFGFFDLLLTIFAFDLLFRRSRVVVTPAGANIQVAWLFFKRERNIATTAIAGFDVESGMTVGHQSYFDLKIRAGEPNPITVANNIADRPEADWLAQQMIAILKTPAAPDANP